MNYHRPNSVIPHGWEEVQDPSSGRVYFANRSTGETSWTLPSDPTTKSGITFSQPPLRKTSQDRIKVNHVHSHIDQNSSRIHGNIDNSFCATAQHLSTRHGGDLLVEENKRLPTIQKPTTLEIMETKAPTFSSNFPLLVPFILGLMQDETSQNKKGVELDIMSGGSLSDLCSLRANQNEGSINLYEPLNVSLLKIDSRLPIIESGRVEVRLHSLYEALQEG